MPRRLRAGPSLSVVRAFKSIADLRLKAAERGQFTVNSRSRRTPPRACCEHRQHVRISSNAAIASSTAGQRPRQEHRSRRRARSACARRRFSSISGPSTMPSSSGARLEIVLDQPVADQAEAPRSGSRRTARCSPSRRRSQQNITIGGIQQAVGHAQQPHPDADQRQVDDDQHQIADPHRGDHAPERAAAASVITCGPGTMPWMVIAPTISAITAFGGMPSVSSGMNEVCAAALLALSGPATPSIAPWPKRDGSLATFFSSV